MIDSLFSSDAHGRPSTALSYPFCMASNAHSASMPRLPAAVFAPPIVYPIMHPVQPASNYRRVKVDFPPWFRRVMSDPSRR
ncbi:MAG: hypothetical protein IJU19_00550 [Bacteroidales bacterium]|nr:hypothetical protein [Bacteroidales bacterium]